MERKTPNYYFSANLKTDIHHIFSEVMSSVIHSAERCCSTQKGQSSGNMMGAGDCSKWNYEADLQLLNLGLSQLPEKGQEEIRELIKVAIGLTDAIKVEFYPEFKAENLRDPDHFCIDRDISPSWIQQTSYLFSQFQKYYREQKLNNQGLQTIKGSGDTLAVKPSKSRKYCSMGGSITREGLKKVLSKFEVFYETVLTPSQKLSPFEVDLTLQAILKFLPRQDLLSCRLINSMWNREAVTIYRKNPKYEIYVTDLKQFSKDIKVKSPFIFTRLRVSLKRSELLADVRFFRKFGAHIRHLIIDEAEHESDQQEQQKLLPVEYHSSLRHLIQNASALESLTLHHLPESVIAQGLSFSEKELKTRRLLKVKTLEIILKFPMNSNFAEGLLALLPNIRKCTLVANNFEEGMYYEILAEAVSKLHLKELHTYCESYPMLPPIEFWGNVTNLRLKVLSITFDLSEKINVKPYEDFLKSQRGTLEVLKVTSAYAFVWKIRLPVMKKLRSLIEILPTHNPFHCIPSSHVPKLELIVVNFEEDHEHPLFEGIFPNVVQMTYLATSDEKGTSSFLTLKRINSLFPNLRQLLCNYVHLCEDALGAIFSCSQLEVLELEIFETNLKERNTSINCLLSGLPMNSLSVWMASQLIAMKLPVMAGIEPPLPSLRNLKNLKSLVLLFRQSSAEEVSDIFTFNIIGVYFGLLQLPPLKLTFYGDFSISDDLKSLLTSYHTSIQTYSTVD